MNPEPSRLVRRTCTTIECTKSSCAGESSLYDRGALPTKNFTLVRHMYRNAKLTYSCCLRLSGIHSVCFYPSADARKKIVRLQKKSATQDLSVRSRNTRRIHGSHTPTFVAWTCRWSNTLWLPSRCALAHKHRSAWMLLHSYPDSLWSVLHLALGVRLCYSRRSFVYWA